ncbi:SDR family NAD(P)-dependent oxidoreductase [Herbiconiux sp. CPCC 205716]|uniref:SDR family NAD(P)-dependent oxidoreductase n=1 Tax=Herbiconiux gentiana TaxID=2970912 RepID=A0ABT2GAG9_9MICO|nr:SDR family NAD(P)-dependent oxidoreductase [Herbiconiux gentiana]MCS5713203.1 SDR family NAD(P)-dependent oxidoreductase [Herbiconiux gentiana]
MTGKVALVTGASSGIGEAIALSLSGAGALVAVGARRFDLLKDLADRAPGEVLPVQLDVGDQDSVRAAIAATIQRFGRLDILVNNAGIMLTGIVDGADTAEWDAMIRTNLLGTMYVTHAALPHLLSSRGTVVQTSSTSGRIASAGGAVNAASKFGVTAFSEALRQEVTAQGVRVVVVAPGFTDTDLASHISDPVSRDMAAQLKTMMRTLQPDDIAAAVLYAVSQPEHVSVNEILIRPTDQQQ